MKLDKLTLIIIFGGITFLSLISGLIRGGDYYDLSGSIGITIIISMITTIIILFLPNKIFP